MSSNSAWTGASPHIDKSDLICKNGCGFYGNPVWDGYCSKCFKEKPRKQQKRPVFDPSNIKSKVSRSVSDVSEFQSKATSLVTKKFDKFDEKSRQQLGRRTKAVKEMFKKTGKGSLGLTPQLSTESQLVTEEWQAFLSKLNPEAQFYLNKLVLSFVDKIQKTGDILSLEHLADQFHEFYSNLTDVINMQQSLSDFSDKQLKEVTVMAERFVTVRLYRLISNVVNAECEEKDLAIQNRIRSLMWVTCHHLECKIDEKKKEVQSLVDHIITDLIEIDSKRTPTEKLGKLVSSCHDIVNALRLSSEGLEASADDFLPGLIYSVLRANPPLLQSNITYITNYAEQMSLQSGETGYFFTNLCCAVSFIEKLTAESLSLTEAEFDHYMSGDALPHNALDPDYMCEGLRLMHHNLESLRKFDQQVENMISSYGEMLEEFDTFKDEILNEIEDVKAQYPLEIRRRTAEIDEPDPIQELLPPPLQPQSVSPIAPKDPLELSQLESTPVVPTKEILNPFSDDFSTFNLNPPLGLSPKHTPGSPEAAPLDPVYFPPELEQFEQTYAWGSSHRDSQEIMHPVQLPEKPKKPGSLTLPPQYTGFTLQGEIIQSIPCDTGNNPFSPQDPFSPPIRGASHNLPPPLVPSAAGSLQPKKEDVREKVGNVFGDLVNSFDKLL